MKKSDLKYGNVVETREGIKYLFTYHDEEDIFVDLTGDGYYYFESLYFNTNYKNSALVIMKVYADYTCKELLWEKKEKPKLTEDEKVILRNIDKDYKYIARDKDGAVCFHYVKPHKESYFWSSYNANYVSDLFPNLFKFIQWEDDEPYSIEELLKGEEK